MGKEERVTPKQIQQSMAKKRPIAIPKRILGCPWDSKQGFEKIKSFLEECKEKTRGIVEYNPDPYLIRYALRYKLIDQEYNLLEDGNWLIHTPKENRAIVLHAILRKSNTTGLGKWVLFPDGWISLIDDTNYYVFEAENEGESSFQYALFLSDLGIMDKPKRSRTEENIHLSRLSNGLGLDILKIIQVQKIQLPAEDEGKQANYSVMIVNNEGGQFALAKDRSSITQESTTR